MVRVKKRYIVIEVLGPGKDFNESITGLSIYEALKNVYHDLYGDFGLAALGTFGVKYYNRDTNIIFIQCNRDPHRQLMHAVALVKSINSNPCVLQTLYKAGTMKSCQKFLLKHSKQELLSRWVEKQRSLMEEAVVSH